MAPGMFWGEESYMSCDPIWFGGQWCVLRKFQMDIQVLPFVSYDKSDDIVHISPIKTKLFGRINLKSSGYKSFWGIMMCY